MSFAGVSLAFLVSATTLGVSTLGMGNYQTYKMMIVELNNCPGKDSIGKLDVKVIRINDSTIGVEGTLDMQEDVPQDAIVNFRLFQKSDGEWEDNILPDEDNNFCDFIKDDDKYYPAIQKQTDLPPSCPFNKKVYTSERTVWQFKDMPATLPYGCHKLELYLKDSAGKELACIYGIAKIAMLQGDDDISDCTS